MYRFDTRKMQFSAKVFGKSAVPMVYSDAGAGNLDAFNILAVNILHFMGMMTKNVEKSLKKAFTNPMRKGSILQDAYQSTVKELSEKDAKNR
jgi:hypothetical protein